MTEETTAALDLLQNIDPTGSLNRLQLWASIAREFKARRFLEIGVWKAQFAKHLLQECTDIENYYLLDPWKSLQQWNKPWNVSEEEFSTIYDTALKEIDFAKSKTVVLRGTTTDMIDRIADNSLDVAYVDGDHTLRGITIDLIRAYSKVKPGGILGGDDFTPSIWQHSEQFEPSLIFPFAIYFAESQGATIYIFANNQFAMVKPPSPSRFRLVNFTDNYGDVSLRSQVRKRSG